MKFLLLLLSVCVSLCSASDDDNDLVFAKLWKSVSLKCGGDSLTWKRKSNGTSNEFQDVPLGENIVTEGGSLTINKLKEEDIATYACFNGAENVKQFEIVLAFRIKRMPGSVSVSIGSSSEDKIKCVVVGDHEVIFRWFKRPEGSEEGSELSPICGVENDNCQVASIPQDEPTAEEVKESKATTTTAKPFTERLSISSGKEDGHAYSTLQIDNVQLEDRAVYVCNAIAVEHQDDTDYTCDEFVFCEEAYTILRAKDPYAALWPFAGIVAEVIVLCLVIFVCERRKKNEDECDTTEDRYTGNNVSSNNSLRQRK